MKKNYFSSGRWKDWFSFSRNERLGIMVLLSIILICAFVLFYLHYLNNNSNQNGDYSDFKKMADEFYASTNNADTYHNESFGSIAEEEFSSINRLFEFDPNKASFDELIKLGVPSYVARNVVKYRDKGGRFKRKQDFSKVYGLKLAEYSRLEPFIVIVDGIKKDSIGTLPRHRQLNEKILVDVGTADTIELTKVKGIGETFARRIFKFRNSLGGYYSVDQLREVFDMSDSLFSVIQPQIYLGDSIPFRFINLNQADYGSLSGHPYINGKLASLIINYRRQHVGFKTIDELKFLPVVNDELFRKLAPYLKTE
jgi:DNA uptake protein ComE-like DNA-binding protein